MLGELIKYYNYDWPQLAMWRICCDRVRPDLDLVSLVSSVCMFVLVCLFTSTSVWDGVTDRESVTDQIINVSLELIQFVLSADLSNQTLGFGHRVPKKKKTDIDFIVFNLWTHPKHPAERCLKPHHQTDKRGGKVKGQLVDQSQAGKQRHFRKLPFWSVSVISYIGYGPKQKGKNIGN